MARQDGKYVFDPRSFSFRKAGRDVWRTVVSAVLYLLITVSLTIFAYALFALVVSTDVERRIKRENKAYEASIPELHRRVQLLEDAVAGLQYKDNSIYRDIFNTDAPSVDPINSLGFLFGSDTVPDVKIVSYTAAKSDALIEDAAVIEAELQRALRLVASPEIQLPPMMMPVRDVSYTQTGASRGSRMNPFLKAYVQHNGLDFIVPQGSPVYAAASGTVVSVTKSGKGLGNVIEIGHEGGFVTRYAHLSEIAVSSGQTVRRGARIGAVGMTGAAYAPHLHYEVRRDSLCLDPVNHLFASVSPEEYANMLFMAVNTEQSMD